MKYNISKPKQKLIPKGQKGLSVEPQYKDYGYTDEMKQKALKEQQKRNHDYLNNPFNLEQLKNRTKELLQMFKPMTIAGAGATAAITVPASLGPIASTTGVAARGAVQGLGIGMLPGMSTGNATTDALGGVGGEMLGPVAGKVISKTAPIVSKGVKSVTPTKVATSIKESRIYNKLPFVPEKQLSMEQVNKLNKVLDEKGILPEQKTLNLPWKEPIRIGIVPYGYGSSNMGQIGKNRFDEIIGFALNKKNPHNQTEFMREALFNRRKEYMKNSGNRYTTWDMYLGKPQLEHPIYKVSPLSTNKKTIYTIKPKYTNTKAIKDELFDYIDLVAKRNSSKTSPFGKPYSQDWYEVTEGNTKDYIIPDDDFEYFDTMGGFNWKLSPLENGNVQAVANDVWDIKPFQGNNFTKSSWLNKQIGKTEVGRVLGIGKPLDVKVGFEFTPRGRLVNQFKPGGKLIKKKEVKPT